MHEEGAAVFVFPALEDLLEVGLDFGEFLGDALAHLFFAEEARWVALLAFGPAGHEAGGILAGCLEIVAVFDEGAVLLDHLEGGEALFFEGFEAGDFLLMGGEEGVGVDVFTSRSVGFPTPALKGVGAYLRRPG